MIKGWGFDSNGPEGAVLKGWVESRFGIFPTFHKEIIQRISSGAWTTYVEEKMSSRFHNNAIYIQLDLLFEFCQWALERLVLPGETHLTLYRGVNSFDEHQIVERIDKRTVVMRLNNLTSFSSDRDIADCFGDTILTVRVPVAKVAFFNSLLVYASAERRRRISRHWRRIPRDRQLLLTKGIGMTALSLEDRALAAFLGFAIGDALGATVEFMTKGEIAAQYGVHRKIIGGGWLRLAPGQ